MDSDSFRPGDVVLWGAGSAQVASKWALFVGIVVETPTDMPASPDPKFNVVTQFWDPETRTLGVPEWGYSSLLTVIGNLHDLNLI